MGEGVCLLPYYSFIRPALVLKSEGCKCLVPALDTPTTPVLPKHFNVHISMEGVGKILPIIQDELEMVSVGWLPPHSNPNTRTHSSRNSITRAKPSRK